ncbi:MAG: clan AA aspartic protease [Rhodocyclaceae bacterium]|nr:clan AA aspartic protease [Rhodocyclaceae bacterium]
MGLVRTTVGLFNARQPELAMDVRALVDTGAVHLCLPPDIAAALGLAQLELREVTLADGRRIDVPYCGPVEVRFGNRRCFTGAMVLGDEPLLGAIPMEDLDLVVLPGRQTVVVNPASPHIATSVAKGMCGSSTT